MNKSIFLTALVLFLKITSGEAQLKDIYDNGEIVLLDGTKLTGLIRIDDISELSKSVCFTEAENIKCKKYGPNEILSFSAESGLQFKTIEATLSNAKVNIFASKIINGYLSMYTSKYDDEKIFILERDTIKYIIRNDNLDKWSSSIQRNNYIGHLNIATEGYASKNVKSVNFDEKTLKKLIVDFNKYKGFDIKEISYKVKPVSIALFSASYGRTTSENEYQIQAMCRTFFPKFSRKTSIYLGVDYFNTEVINFNYLGQPTGNNTFVNQISIPIALQYNIFNKQIRPYVFGGFSPSYYYAKGTNLSLIGERSNFRLALLFGGGIEIDIYKGIFVKAEWKDELVRHPIHVGIGYLRRI